MKSLSWLNETEDGGWLLPSSFLCTHGKFSVFMPHASDISHMRRSKARASKLFGFIVALTNLELLAISPRYVQIDVLSIVEGRPHENAHEI